MQRFFVPALALVLGFALVSPGVAVAFNVDLSITASSIRFSKSVLYAGDTVRLYATIHNYGSTDSVAQVVFYQGEVLIGTSQPISVIADGGGDDVFVDYTLPPGAFNIRAVIQGAAPADDNPNNDVALTPLFRTILDDDRDEVENPDDNCIDEQNLDQKDLDDDGKGDACDNDIDNDGVANSQDVYPEDSRKSQLEVTPPTVIVPPPKAVTSNIPTPTPTTASPSAPAAVLGDQQEVIADENLQATSEDIAMRLADTSRGQLLTSLAAQFTYHQIGWRTYEFKAIPPLGDVEYAYAWNFGDGATSVQSSITHTFPKAGNYSVTLAMVGPDNTVVNDSDVIKVSVFHLTNPLVVAALGVLLVVLVGLIVFIVRLRKGEGYD